MDTTGSGSSAPYSKSVKRKPNDINWGGAREGAGRKKKRFPSSASQPLASSVGLSTQILSAANSHPASPIPSSQPATAAVGFFAPRLPSIYHPVTNSRVLGSSSVVSVNQADAEGPQGMRVTPDQGVLPLYCVFLFPNYILHS